MGIILPIILSRQNSEAGRSHVAIEAASLRPEARKVLSLASDRRRQIGKKLYKNYRVFGIRKLNWNGSLFWSEFLNLHICVALYFNRKWQTQRSSIVKNQHRHE